MHDGICVECARDELLNDEGLCPRCYVIQGGYVRDGLGDFDADELGIDPNDDE